MTISNWKLSRNSVPLAQVLTFVPKIDQAKVVSKALDGTIYVQTIGAGTKYASVSIFASEAELEGVNSAEADGALLSIIYKETKYLGYIEVAPDWQTEIPGEWYKTDIKFLIEEEVPV